MAKKPSLIAGALPAIVQAALSILGGEAKDLITYKELPEGGCIIIYGQGQKFTFTAEQLEHKAEHRAQLQKEGVRVLKPLADKPAVKASAPTYKPDSLMTED